ncbi:MAG: hypothetical protein HYW71_00010 [Candidatus Niyogibacteria bacterium]|nr:hypothetical protein [Candidatus Niyogibacteria bacterium]
MADEKPKNREFEKLFSEVQQLRKRLLTTIASHKIFNQFNKLLAPNIVGKRKAEKNVKVFGNYVYFFSTTKEATRCYFLIELAKFFDTLKPKNETRSIYWVLDYAKKNIHRLTREDFTAYHDGQQIIPEIFASYKQLEISDLKKLQKRLTRNKDAIKRLKTYRDQYLAHDDIKKITVKLTVRKTEVLLRIVRDVVELFYHRLEFASNSYKNFEEEPVMEVDRLIKNLAEHEKQRLEEIRKRYAIK